MQTFDSGATRDNSDDKLDFEGFFSPLALERYAQYMHKHRQQADGQIRDSDNWQKGIPLVNYIKSCWRHFLDLWFLHRGHRRFEKRFGELEEIDAEEACCAIIFNAMGYMHTLLMERYRPSCGRVLNREQEEAAIFARPPAPETEVDPNQVFYTDIIGKSVAEMPGASGMGKSEDEVDPSNMSGKTIEKLLHDGRILAEDEKYRRSHCVIPMDTTVGDVLKAVHPADPFEDPRLADSRERDLDQGRPFDCGDYPQTEERGGDF